MCTLAAPSVANCFLAAVTWSAEIWGAAARQHCPPFYVVGAGWCATAASSTRERHGLRVDTRWRVGGRILNKPSRALLRSLLMPDCLQAGMALPLVLFLIILPYHEDRHSLQCVMRCLQCQFSLNRELGYEWFWWDSMISNYLGLFFCFGGVFVCLCPLLTCQLCWFKASIACN